MKHLNKEIGNKEYFKVSSIMLTYAPLRLHPVTIIGLIVKD